MSAKVLPFGPRELEDVIEVTRLGAGWATTLIQAGRKRTFLAEFETVEKAESFALHVATIGRATRVIIDRRSGGAA